MRFFFKPAADDERAAGGRCDTVSLQKHLAISFFLFRGRACDLAHRGASSRVSRLAPSAIDLAMEYHALDGAATDFAGKTLVLPLVSHGNVGQLAADLLVNTLMGSRADASSLTRLGCLDHPALLPCVGCGAFEGTGADALALGAELFGGAAAPDVVFAQQRAEIAPGAHRSFAADVAAWIRAAGFRAVIALASVPSTAARTPDVIGATLFRHVTASGAPDPRCEALKHPRVAVPYAESEVGPSTPDAALPPWSLLRACAAEGVDATCVVAVCSEGDNSDDARDMADVVAGVLGLDGDDRGNDRGDERGDDHGDDRGDAGDVAASGRWRAPPSWASAYGQRCIARAMFT